MAIRYSEKTDFANWGAKSVVFTACIFAQIKLGEEWCVEKVLIMCMAIQSDLCLIGVDHVL